MRFQAKPSLITVCLVAELMPLSPCLSASAHDITPGWRYQVISDVYIGRP